MTGVYIVRHCEAYGNRARVFQGISDCEVTELGMRQLDYLAERFRGISFDKIYSSPLKRAYQTAEAVNRYHGLPITVEQGLIEINGGEIEGIGWEDFPKTKPVLEYNWNIEPHKFSPLGGEAMTAVYKRAHETLARLVQENNEKTIVLATHGCVIRNLMCHEMGLPIERLNEVPWADNTGVFYLQYEGSDLPEIKLFNDYSHLPQECLPSASRIGHASFAEKKG